MELGRLGSGGNLNVHSCWQDTSRKVEYFLNSLPATDHDIAAHPKFVESAAFNFAGLPGSGDSIRGQGIEILT
jgi:hypothetical protein